MDAQARCRFTFRQHAAVAQSLRARAERVFVNQIGDPHGREARLASAAASRAAGTKALHIKHVSDLGIDMGIEQGVDQLDDPERRLYLLGGGFGVQRRERLGLPPLKADVDLRRAFCWELEQRGILDEGGEQALAVAVGRAGILPERAEIRRQGG
jgi:hypothetical protein